MIHFIAGKPRSGKGLWAVKKLLEQLTTTQRHIVTNMLIHLDKLQEYLDAKGHNIHAMDRITMLSDEDMKLFYLHRGGGYVLPRPDGFDTPKSETNVDYTPIFAEPRFRVGGVMNNPDGSTTDLKGVAYFYDEVHNDYGARSWQQTPRHVTFYLSQHGKLNDIVFFTTQAIKNCDPVLYRLAQDFTYCRNRRIEKYGMFRGVDGFTAKTYLSPLANADTQVACEVVNFKLDLAEACLYDTSKGTGMPGGTTADASARAKGIPIRALIAVGAVLVIGFWCFVTFVMPKYTRSFFQSGVAPKTGSGAAPAKAASPSVAQSIGHATGLMPTAQVPNGVFGSRDLPPAGGPSAQEVFATGYIVRNGRANVQLSDGRVLDETDRAAGRPLIAAIRRHAVDLADGTTLPIKAVVATAPPAPSITSSPSEAVAPTASPRPQQDETPPPADKPLPLSATPTLSISRNAETHKAQSPVSPQAGQRGGQARATAQSPTPR